jgi:hypothetical protein
LGAFGLKAKLDGYDHSWILGRGCPYRRFGSVDVERARLTKVDEMRMVGSLYLLFENKNN